MSGFLVLLILVALLFPLLLYVFTERETADPQVVTRREAERMAKERGGRRTGREDPRDDADDDRRAGK
ncbi:MAG: hypothetical protein V5A55_05925 [Halovenus sp.]